MEQRVLRRWAAAARAFGVDGVEDLASRPWPVSIPGALIGVFRFGDESAAWLVVGQNGSWVVASCSDGSVSPSSDSLADALAMVYPAGEAPEAL